MARGKKRITTQPGYVTYLRTSNEDAQAPERSQNGQRRDIQRLLAAYPDLPHLGEYIDNYTGTSADRKHYQLMLSDARKGAFSHVFAAVPDRFGRDDVEALRAIDELTRLGICVRFATHPDLDPADEDDRLYLNILFGMAKRESALIGRRVRNGQLSKLLAGGWPWHAPDGYVNKEVRLSELGQEEQLKHAKYKRWVEKDPAQAAVWRYAWDLLLQDGPTYDDICEALAAQGYRLRDGRPFLRVNYRGKVVSNRQALSRVFHNWFYAGWVVVQNDWADIPPKTVRGEWEPVVSTEEFEYGLAILAKRNRRPTPKKRNFYLLQGLVFIEMEDGEQIKLRCSRPNKKRTANGASYYRVSSSEIRFPCSTIDAQIPAHLRHIQIDPEQLPAIRRLYSADMYQYVGTHSREQSGLKAALERLEAKEMNLWRGYTEHGMRAQVYSKLSLEYQAERERIEVALLAAKQENGDCIANLDVALSIIAEIGERYVRQDEQRQRDILRQVVSKVVIDTRGKILRLELQPPFTYLCALAHSGGLQAKREKQEPPSKNGKPSQNHAGCSLPVGFSEPSGTYSEQSKAIATTIASSQHMQFPNKAHLLNFLQEHH